MDFLDLVDEYEEEAYGSMIGLQICQHFDCRDPRRGPFAESEDGLVCQRCYVEYVRPFL